MPKFALVVVDLQEDFLPSQGALAVPEGRAIVPLITDLLNLPWTAVVATQDWHPPNHTSFASQHGVEPYTEVDFPHPLGEEKDGKVVSQKQVVWPDHCVQNSIGASIEPLFLAIFNQMFPHAKTAVVRKGSLPDREYYLCFQDTWKLHKTEMEDYLRLLEVTDVVFVGLAYDFCVVNSAVDCLAAGFHTYVIKECSKSVFPDKTTETDEKYAAGGVKVLETAAELPKWA